MPFIREDDGTWRFGSPPPGSNPEYEKAVPAYLTAYDRLFIAAKERSQFEFICAIVHRDKDSNRDPFETTKTTFFGIYKLHEQTSDYVTEVSLSLWLYGHIVEASYPYQLVGDLAGIAAGQRHRLSVFPRDNEGHEISPGRKITQIEKTLQPIGLKVCVKPMRASWNGDLRNAIFHSNYAIVGSDIYLPEVGSSIAIEDAVKRVNRAMAAFESFGNVLNLHRALYTEPVEIDTPIEWSHKPGSKATVVVREGYGPVAIHDTVEDFGVKSPVILGRLYADEIDLVRAGIFKLPRHEAT